MEVSPVFEDYYDELLGKLFDLGYVGFVDADQDGDPAHVQHRRSVPADPLPPPRLPGAWGDERPGSGLSTSSM